MAERVAALAVPSLVLIELIVIVALVWVLLALIAGMTGDLARVLQRTGKNASGCLRGCGCAPAGCLLLPWSATKGALRRMLGGASGRRSGSRTPGPTSGGRGGGGLRRPSRPRGPASDGPALLRVPARIVRGVVTTAGEAIGAVAAGMGIGAGALLGGLTSVRGSREGGRSRRPQVERPPRREPSSVARARRAVASMAGAMFGTARSAGRRVRAAAAETARNLKEDAAWAFRGGQESESGRTTRPYPGYGWTIDPVMAGAVSAALREAGIRHNWRQSETTGEWFVVLPTDEIDHAGAVMAAAGFTIEGEGVPMEWVEPAPLAGEVYDEETGEWIHPERAPEEWAPESPPGAEPGEAGDEHRPPSVDRPKALPKPRDEPDFYYDGEPEAVHLRKGGSSEQNAGFGNGEGEK